MKNRIKQYKSDLAEVTDGIKSDLSDYFSSHDYSIIDKSIQIIPLHSESDISQVYYGSGFYIILTDHDFDDNECTFSFNNQRAIYRGHCQTVRQRILSHLANDTYSKEFGGNGKGYQVCLKIENGINGINIEQEPYSKWKWTVIVHKMRHSNKIIREQAELAFDEVFEKPCKSREVDSKKS